MKPPAGQGPFQKGERLTAAKLNELLAPSRVVASGHGHSEGFAVIGDIPEEMWIRLTGKSGASTPIKYAWKQVARANASAWQDLGRTGSTTNDYAAEINNNNVSVGNLTVYKAWRSETTSEWLFYANGTVTPPSDPCVDGICSSPPSSITIIWPAAEGDYVYPGTFPNYGATPGYQCFYNDPNDPRFPSLQWETVNGWTYHYASFQQKIADIAASTVTVPTSLGNWLETEIDVTSEFADIFPMFCDYKRYNGPGLFPDTTPQLDFENTCETNIVYAKRFVRVFMEHGGSCRMFFSVQQRIEISIESTWEQTTYEFGPFGIPGGSTTLSGGTTLSDSSTIIPGATCGTDGDDAVDTWNGWTGPDVVPQIIGDGYPTYENTGYIDCGDAEISFALEPFDVLSDAREGLAETVRDVRPISYIVQDNDL